MKKVLLPIISIVVLFITGCYHIEITSKIHPKLTVIGDKVGMVYKLGNLDVMDQFDNLGTSTVAYIKTHDDVEFFVKIVCNTNMNYKTQFFYYLNGILIANHKNVVSGELLIKNRNSIPNFVCIKGDCEVSSQNDSVVKDEETPKPKATDSPVENKNMKSKEIHKL